MNGYRLKCCKRLDLGITDADWMSLRNELHLIVVEFGSCSFTSVQFTVGFSTLVCSVVLCAVCVLLVCSVTFCRFWWDLRWAATKLLRSKTCTRSSMRDNQVLAAEDDSAVEQKRRCRSIYEGSFWTATLLLKVQHPTSRRTSYITSFCKNFKNKSIFCLLCLSSLQELVLRPLRKDCRQEDDAT